MRGDPASIASNENPKPLLSTQTTSGEPLHNTGPDPNSDYDLVIVIVIDVPVVVIVVVIIIINVVVVAVVVVFIFVIIEVLTHYFIDVLPST